jgi:hypothetical protein
MFSKKLEIYDMMDAFRKYQAASLVNKFEESIVKKDTTDLSMNCEHSLNNKRACATIAYELNDRLNVGVQIEHDQLRIFFEKKDKDKNFNTNQAQHYWEKWLGKPLGKGRVVPDDPNKHQEDDYYCSYSNSFIYRYVKFDNITTEKLCERVKDLLGNISDKKDDIINKIYDTEHQ